MKKISKKFTLDMFIMLTKIVYHTQLKFNQGIEYRNYQE